MIASQKRSLLVWVERLPFTREGLLWLLIALAMLVTGLLKGINLIILLSCWLVVLIAWNWWLARRQLRCLDVAGIVPDFVFAQTPFRWTVNLTNAGRRAAHGVVVREDAAPQSWFVRCADAGQTVRLEGEATLPRRGACAWNRLRLACGYPVGLANIVRDAGRPEELLVLPRPGTLQRGVLRHWLSQHSPSQGPVRAAARRQPTAQLEFHGLRAFRPGDSPRHIHWRTTARRGEVMVREFEDLPNDNLVLIVDPRTPAAAPIGTNAELERLVSLAATIAWEWCRQKGDEFALAVAGASPVLLPGVTGRELALRVLKELARVTGSPASWSGLLALLEHARLPEAAVLVLTLRADAPLEDLSQCLRRPVACVNVARAEEQAFYLDGEPIKNLR
ncbi:MAG: DUF58 domain-containing protein [Gemmataceae bacterium]|nr:DUF58 domain-containing protein [Gemmataceae bacterium]